MEMGEEEQKKKKKKKRKKEKETKNESQENERKRERKDTNGKEIPSGEEKDRAGHTLSIAVAGSIIDNAQSLELATLLAGQIARAATIFRVHEVIVFDDKAKEDTLSKGSIWHDEDENESGGLFLARILHYLEIPQYLRRAIVPKYNSLRYVGILPPLDAPHHVRKHEWVPYREGFFPFSGRLLLLSFGPLFKEDWQPHFGINGEVLDYNIFGPFGEHCGGNLTSKRDSLSIVFAELSGLTLERKSATGYGTLVDVGLQKEVVIEQSLKPGMRITVAMGSNRSLEADCIRKAVKSSEPREKAGLYWGYTVRYASNISAVFKECPYQGGYDYSIGTSEHGDTLRSADLEIPKFRHLLIAFGGLGGLEENIEIDKDLKSKDVTQLFSRYLNTCPNQGSRTIRTEEAIFISLQYFQDSIERAMKSTTIR